jgi:flagellum-specific ATP synthase
MATYREAEDLINIGAYVKGSNPNIDYAISKMEKINAFFRQGIYELVPHTDAVAQLNAIMEG